MKVASPVLRGVVLCKESFLLEHIKKRNLLKKWQEIADILPEFTKVTIGYNYIEMILSYTLTKIDQSDKMELEKLLTSKLNQQTGIKLMGSLAQHWEQIGEARGEARLVKTMIKNGSSIEEISRMTKLSITKIRELLKINT
ncbi:hypothetical protein [Candidatus Tisiphia endosymbiont of Micropterix aruncella]|uniref:hypothetical protein n=1 Tax=Candidatus Tisiphia endosymbiont of Micropterix aruncella TaxID=3066271 RepID=UPI003AA86101